MSDALSDFFQRELFAGSRHDKQKVVKWSCSQAPAPTSSPTATSKETIVQTCSVCSSMWVMVMLLVLLCRWAGGGAEKDVHKMDQFPFGKGKSLFPLLLPVLFCLKHWRHCCGLKTPLIASFTFICIAPPWFMWCCFPQHTAELVTGPSVPAQTSHTAFLTCLYSFSFVQFQIACSMDLLSLQLWF